MVDPIEKNKLDLKYQTVSGLGFKILGLAFTIPLGLIGANFFNAGNILLWRLGLTAFLVLSLIAFIFLYRSWNYLDELEKMKK